MSKGIATVLTFTRIKTGHLCTMTVIVESPDAEFNRQLSEFLSGAAWAEVEHLLGDGEAQLQHLRSLAAARGVGADRGAAN